MREENEDWSSCSDQELTSNMKKLKDKRKEIEKELFNLEKQIYNLETSYLEETGASGNLLNGWEGYLTSRPSSSVNKKNRVIKESDRIFSGSSVDAIENIENENKDRKKRRKHHPYQLPTSSTHRPTDKIRSRKNVKNDDD